MDGFNSEEEWKKAIVTPRVAAAGVVENPARTKVVIIDREYEPLGLAFPGGMMELGETIEQTAVREIKEETQIDAEPLGLLHVLSDPDNDPRWHVVLFHLIMRAPTDKDPVASDDAKDAFWMDYESDKYVSKMTQVAKKTLMSYRNWRKKETDLMKLR